MSFQIPKSALTNETTTINFTSSINDIAPENKQLYSYIKDPRYVRDNGQRDTNIISRGNGCACFPPDVLQQFLALTEKARRAGFNPILGEKQESSGSGIFIDVDIHQPSNIMEHQYNVPFFSKIIRQIFLLLIDMFDLSAYPKPAITIGVTYKKNVTTKDLGSGMFANSAGFHLLIPGLKITRGAKKHLISEISRRGIIATAIASNGIKTLNAESKYLDTNSAHVANFFVGCARELGRPVHELMHVFDAEGYDSSDNLNITPNYTLVANNPAVNIVGEFSLNYETVECYIPKVPIKPTLKHAPAIDKLDNAASHYIEDFNEESEIMNEYDLSTSSDPGMKYINDVMSIITLDRSFKHSDVWPILQTLANMGEKYKKTAETFVRRFPEKFKNMSDFNQRWSSARSSYEVAKQSGTTVRTFKYIESIAKKCDKAKFQSIQDNHEIMNIYQLAFDPKTVGKFQHADIAKILYQMYSEEYVIDYEPGAKTPQWFKMMLPGDADLQPGEMFKWRPFAEPISLSKVISDSLARKFSIVLGNMQEKIKTLSEDIAGINKVNVEYLKRVIKDFQISCCNLRQHQFKRSVIAECKELFNKRGFIEQLDADDMIMGVGNGLLRFCNNGFVEFINHIHEYKVCTSTKVNWVKFNPRDENVKTMLLCLRSMFSDEDSDKFELVMNYASLGLTGKQKPSKMFMLYGGGRNGKSMFMEWLRNVFGDYGGKGSSSLIVGATSANADGASPALYAIKGKRFMSYGECGPNSSLNVQFFKEILGGEKQTARPLFGQLSSFYAKCVHFLPLNNLLKIHNTDYATWRRVVLIKHTIKFFNRASPDYDPRNPCHRIQDKYIKDPSTLAQNPIYLEALLSYLVYTWERLQYKYDGDLDKIPHPHVKADTAYYKSTQDTFDDFINRRFVKLADATARFDMSKLIMCYVQWMETKGHGKGIRGDDLEDKLRDSKISDYIKSDRIGAYLLGHKFLLPTEELPPGASYVYEVGIAKPANIEEQEREKAFTEGKVTLGGDKQIKKELEEAQEEMKLIQAETPEQFYERVCREYDMHEHRRETFGKLARESKDSEIEEEIRKIEVAEHEFMVQEIRKNAAIRKTQEDLMQAERMQAMLSKAGIIEPPTRDTDTDFESMF